MGLKEDEFIYVLIRVPKSASTSLMHMFSNAYPNSQSFSIHVPPRLTENDPLIEKIRTTKNYKLSLFKKYRCLSEECMWQKVNTSLKPNDIVSGHFKIDEIKTNKYQNRLITLIRDPIDRVVSDYNYMRLGYAKRNILQKAYNSNKLMAAGKYNLEGYLSYMNEHYDDFGSYMKDYIISKDFSGDGLDFMLENYFSFGTVERIDRFIDDFKKKTGITLVEEVSNKTKRKKINKLSTNELALIEKICSVDIDLYRKIDNYLESQRG